MFYSTTKRIHHRLFLEYVPTTRCLKKYFEKKSMLNEHFNIIKLQPSNTQPVISSKNGANDGTIVEALKILMYLQEDLFKEVSVSKFLMSVCLQRQGFKVQIQVKRISGS